MLVKFLGRMIFCMNFKKEYVKEENGAKSGKESGKVQHYTLSSYSIPSGVPSTKAHIEFFEASGKDRKGRAKKRRTIEIPMPQLPYNKFSMENVILDEGQEYCPHCICLSQNAQIDQGICCSPLLCAARINALQNQLKESANFRVSQELGNFTFQIPPDTIEISADGIQSQSATSPITDSSHGKSWSGGTQTTTSTTNARLSGNLSIDIEPRFLGNLTVSTGLQGANGESTGTCSLQSNGCKPSGNATKEKQQCSAKMGSEMDNSPLVFSRTRQHYSNSGQFVYTTLLNELRSLRNEVKEKLRESNQNEEKSLLAGERITTKWISIARVLDRLILLIYLLVTLLFGTIIIRNVGIDYFAWMWSQLRM